MRNDRNIDCSAPVAIWKEEDMIGTKRVKAMVTILRTRGCWWSKEGGCTMCGYNVESVPDVSIDNLRVQLRSVIAKYDGEEMMKVYTSGSFLDDREMPRLVRDELFAAFPTVERFLFETRPEFVTDEAIDTLPPGRCAIALGLESADDDVLDRSIRKGFHREDYERAAGLLDHRSIPLRTYLLLKPPFLTEARAIQDTVASVEVAQRYSDTISINPLNVQTRTLVEALWRRGDYRPPWIWSLIDVLKATAGKGRARVMSSPSGGGTPRGVHNCGKCDRKLLDAVERFSVNQDIAELDGLDCGCRREWEGLLYHQDRMRTSVDLERHLGNELDR
jgi:radical SAM enzyme (TIGR01210 family)